MSEPLLGLLLRLAAQQWGTDMEAGLRAAGVEELTPAHSHIMPFVPPEGASIGELARLARVRKQSMAQSVEQLVASGHVTRSPNPADRRATLVFLTDKGRALRPASKAVGEQVERDWAAVIGDEALHELRGTLKRLLAAGN